MATYVDAVDLSDPALTITEKHCASADVFVNAELRKRGIDPADLTLPIDLLTEIAGNWAKRVAAIDGSIGDDSPLIAKAKEFDKDARLLASSINREALGLTVPTGAGYGNVVVGRG
jgi:hypothetical protein